MSSLITIKDFQSIYSVSRATVYRLRERGHLRFVNIGRAVRIRREDADAWAASLTADRLQSA